MICVCDIECAYAHSNLIYVLNVTVLDCITRQSLLKEGLLFINNHDEKLSLSSDVHGAPNIESSGCRMSLDD